MSYYNNCSFSLDGFKYESFCQGLEDVLLLAVKPEITSKLSCVESSIKNAVLNAELGDYVAKVYAPEEKVYVGEVVKNNEDDFLVSFLQHIVYTHR